MSDARFESGIESAKQIAELYESETAKVPRLSSEDVRMVGDFLRDNGYVMIAGYMADQPIETIGHALSSRRKFIVDPGGEAFRGPHIMSRLTEDGRTEHWYVANALAIWSPAEAQE